MIASMLESFAEAFATLRKAEVPPQAFLEIMSALFGSPVYSNYGRLIADGKFEPAGFALRLGLKDVRLVLQTAEECAAPMPLASVIQDQCRLRDGARPSRAGLVQRGKSCRPQRRPYRGYRTWTIAPRVSEGTGWIGLCWPTKGHEDAGPSGAGATACQPASSTIRHGLTDYPNRRILLLDADPRRKEPRGPAARHARSADSADLLFGSEHGQGIARAIQEQSEDVLLVDHGALYPRCSAWNKRAGLRPNGAIPKTIAKRGSTP